MVHEGWGPSNLSASSIPTTSWPAFFRRLRVPEGSGACGTFRRHLGPALRKLVLARENYLFVSECSGRFHRGITNPAKTEISESTATTICGGLSFAKCAGASPALAAR